jgi:hypothetical protein
LAGNRGPFLADRLRAAPVCDDTAIRATATGTDQPARRAIAAGIACSGCIDTDSGSVFAHRTTITDPRPDRHTAG